MKFCFILQPVLLMALFLSCGKEAKIQDKLQNEQISPTQDEVYFEVLRNLNTSLLKDNVQKFSSLLSNHPKIQIDEILNVNGDTFLIKAIKNDAVKIRDYLLKMGANPNKKNISLDSPLSISVALNKKDSVKKLLEYNANLETQNSRQETPLIIALKMNNEDLAILLLRNGAMIDVKDSHGKTIFQMAREMKFQQVQTIIENIISLQHQKLSPENFQELLQKGDLDLLSWFLHQYPDFIFEKKFKKIDPFLLLLQHEDEFHAIKMAEILINHNIHPDNIENKTSSPALILAVKENKNHLVNFLLSKESNIEVTDKNGKTALIVAIEENNPAMVSLLLYYSAQTRYSITIEDSKKIFDACQVARTINRELISLTEKDKNKTIRSFLLKCRPIRWPF